MKVYLSHDEYNNNITPSYIRDDEFALDDQVTLTFSGSNSGQLIIQGDAFRVMAILRDIALEKSTRQFRDTDARPEQEEIIYRMTRGFSIVFSCAAREYLASCSFTGKQHLYRTLCGIASRALRTGKTSVEPDFLAQLNSDRFFKDGNTEI